MRFNRITIKTKTPPTALAVPLAEMKRYLRVDNTDDDTLITDLIKSSAEVVKQYLKRPLISETFELYMDGFGDVENQGDENLLRLGAGEHVASYPFVLGGGDYIELPFPPIKSVTSITTYDRSNNATVFASTNYQVDELGGRIYLNEGCTFPDNLRNRESIKIEFIAGYGDTDTSIPLPIKQVIKSHVACTYDCKDNCDITGNRTLAPYKLRDYLGFV